MRAYLVAILVVASAILAVMVGFALAGAAAVVRTAFYIAVVGFVIGVLWIVHPPE